MIKDWVVIQTYIYARNKNKPIPKIEPVIALSGEASYFYALKVLRGRFVAGEKEIAKTPSWAVKYARFVLRGRFKIAEKYIAGDPELCYDYFRHVVKKKLPERMHNSMILSAYANPKNNFVNKYFQEIK